MRVLMLQARPAEYKPNKLTLNCPNQQPRKRAGLRVIIEIKRPSHQLTLADLNQTERYVVLAENFSSNTDWAGILVGQTADDDVRRTVKHRKSVTVRTYNERLKDTQHRYREYLKAFEAKPSDTASEVIAASRLKAVTKKR